MHDLGNKSYLGKETTAKSIETKIANLATSVSANSIYDKLINGVPVKLTQPIPREILSGRGTDVTINGNGMIIIKYSSTGTTDDVIANIYFDGNSAPYRVKTWGRATSEFEIKTSIRITTSNQFVYTAILY